MAQRRTRRVRSPHPGVVVRRRSYKDGRPDCWIARWTDPESGRAREASLDAADATNETKRTAWAKAKSAELALIRHEFETGVRTKTRTTVTDAVKLFLDDCANNPSLRGTTVRAYRECLLRFEGWANETGLVDVQDLDRPRLNRFHHALNRMKRRAPARAGDQGEYRTTDTLLSARTRNKIRITLGAAIRSWRLAGFVTRLSHEQVKEVLTPEKLPRPEPDPLSPTQIRELLEAARRHDEVRYEKTRTEHAAHPSAKRVGVTPRHEPMVPAVLLLLLTGQRAGELLSRRWEHVDLEAKDDFGQPSGEIRIRADESKTKRPRRIDLSVAPSLRRLLTLLRARRGDDVYLLGGREQPDLKLLQNGFARLVKFGAPRCTPQRLRQTCASYLTSAGGIFAAASLYRSAEQLGHGPEVAQRHYLNAVRGIPHDAKTLEAAMGVEDLVDALLDELQGRPARRRRARRGSAQAEDVAAAG